MNIVNPINFLGGLGWYDLQINHDRFLAATHEHTAQRFLAAGVDLLVWHKGWHINKIARTCVGHILQVLAPPHARRLWRVGIELVDADNLHAMLAPINFWNAVNHDSIYRVPASR